MSGRTTAEIVRDLRGFVDYYGCDPGVPMSAVDEAAEAADRLAELDAEVAILRLEVAVLRNAKKRVAS